MDQVFAPENRQLGMALTVGFVLLVIILLILWTYYLVRPTTVVIPPIPIQTANSNRPLAPIVR